MKNKTDHFNDSLLMGSHLSLLSELVLEKAAFLLSLQKALDGKDGLSEDERFSDETYELQDNYFTLLSSFLAEADENSTALFSLLTDSDIFSETLLEAIKKIIACKEEYAVKKEGDFSPFIENDIYDEACFRFLSETCFLFRVYYWLTDIETGIQDYGIQSYAISTTEIDKEKEDDFLLNLYDFKKEDFLKELKADCSFLENDTDEMTKEKSHLWDFIQNLEDIK